MSNILKDIFKDKVVIVGIGNTLKGDDAFGPVFIERLKGAAGCPLIDAGVTPENHTKKIAEQKPDKVLLVDAADLGKKPGEWEILKEDEILKSGFTTHDMSPALFINYLKETTGADIYLLGVQPERVVLGSEMSESVKKTMEEVLKAIEEIPRTLP